jgi:hypothetical protein
MDEEEEAAAPGPTFTLNAVPVPGDGDCLFSSVALILLDWLDRQEEDGARQEVPAQDVRDVARYLRSLVASRILDRTDEESERMLATWRRLWADARAEAAKGDAAALTQELQHLDESICGGGGGDTGDPPPLTLAQRRALFRNMMDPRRYWGDEFALRTLEACLDARFCVVDERLSVIKRELNESPRISALCRLPADILPADAGPFLGILLLRHAHYEPAATDSGQKAWALRDLPVQLQRILNFLRQGATQ